MPTVELLFLSGLRPVLVYYKVFLFWHFSLHVLQAVCSIAFRCFPIFWWCPCTHLQSSSQRCMCIPLLTHGVYLLWSSLLSDNLLHTLKPPWWTQTPVSVSSTGKYCLASPACTRASGPLVEAGTWLDLFLHVRRHSTPLPVGQCWKSIISFLSSFLVVYGEGHGTPLQYSCLENPMDGGAW